jgi:hypothetical protein
MIVHDTVVVSADFDEASGERRGVAGGVRGLSRVKTSVFTGSQPQRGEGAAG